MGVPYPPSTTALLAYLKLLCKGREAHIRHHRIVWDEEVFPGLAPVQGSEVGGVLAVCDGSPSLFLNV